MCYMVVVSTTSELNLSELNTPLIRFARQIPNVPEHALLRFPNKWYLGSKDGCSCGFRHLDHENTELGFTEPVDWWPEDMENIEATRQAVEVFRLLLSEGAQVDCVDAWAHGEEEPAPVEEMRVNLASVPATCFRFIEDYRFELTNEI